MPRANRYFIPGYVWHITHRCHKREFLLRFSQDRQAWIRWLFEARKRYGLEILNYVVTSNHVHLSAYGGTDREAIPRSMQLVAGRTAQEYNQRKQRKGAFWEDRYHATAVETDEHLARCLTYIDLNMVRAGVVRHPAMWTHGGHSEIINPPARYRLIARGRLLNLLSIAEAAFQTAYPAWIGEAMSAVAGREPVWSESIAVGGKQFVERIKEELGARASGRKVHEGLQGGMNALRESAGAYTSDFEPKSDLLSRENGLIFDVFDGKSSN